jgi:hypothetical protein
MRNLTGQAQSGCDWVKTQHPIQTRWKLF